MKKVAIVAAMLTLAGCVQVDNYQEVIKHPVPSQLAGYWQSKGPQSAMVSPEAIATLVVTPEGDTLDCRVGEKASGRSFPALQRVLNQPDADASRVTEERPFAICRRGHGFLAVA